MRSNQRCGGCGEYLVLTLMHNLGPILPYSLNPSSGQSVMCEEHAWVQEAPAKAKAGKPQMPKGWQEVLEMLVRATQ